MKVVLITGVTGGLGQEFIRQMLNEDIDQIWALGRSTNKLVAIKSAFGDKIRPLSFDLSNIEDLKKINELFEKEKPDIRYLINNAGMAKMDKVENFSIEEISSTIDVNCKAATILSQYALPYMSKGSHILNISSASSFQPTPRISLYGATKAFLKSYSRAMNVELKDKGIHVCAICPGWIDTDMLDRKTKDGKKIKYPGMVSPEKVVKKAIKDAKRNKDMSVCSFFVKYEHFCSKVMPHKLIMKIWMRSISKYEKD